MRDKVPRVAHVLRVTACVAVVLGALTALSTYHAHWHNVGHTDWGSAFCWAPDCRPSAPGPPAWSSCTGYEHHHDSALPAFVLPVIIVLGIAVAAVEQHKRRFVAALLVTSLGFWAWSVYTTFLRHLLDAVGPSSPAESIFQIAGFVTVPAAVIALVAVFVEGRPEDPSAWPRYAQGPRV